MKKTLSSFLLSIVFTVFPALADVKPRLLVLTDIGGDPDDQQSMIRLMTYSCDFELEGLIASAAGTVGELGIDIVKPHLIQEIVTAYGQVRENLLVHRPGYPTADYLQSIIKSGNPKRGVENVGEGKDTEGSNWIISKVDREDTRPLNITIWGGSTELAQALWRVREDRTAEQLHEFLGKIRVYAIGHQDDTGPWILENFPDLFYILGKAPDHEDMRVAVYRGMYLGGDESLTSLEWLDRYVRQNHGPLGALYPPKTWTAPNTHSALKEGDTPSWFYFLPNGLSNPEHPEWGSWGGRFLHVGRGLYGDALDRVGKIDHPRATVWRWRPDYQNDFQARMDWCVQSQYDQANHEPIPHLQGDSTRSVLHSKAPAGHSLSLSAQGSSDPDEDKLDYQWFVYPEAGTYDKTIEIESSSQESCMIPIPKVAEGRTIHVILRVTDKGLPPLTRYRRAVIEVTPVEGNR